MAHSKRFAFHGVKRLAADTGLDSATVSRVIRSEVNPKFSTVALIAQALEKDFKRKIDPRELVAPGAAFPTRFTCELCNCPGCLPEIALDAFGETTQTYQSIKPGNWVTSRYPRGLEPEKGV
jgi:transcriptional regulator with XRE-family HTH domain